MDNCKFLGFASVMEKVTAYNKRQMICEGFGLTQSTFRSRNPYNNDILLNEAEQSGVVYTFEQIENYMYEMFVSDLTNEGIVLEEGLLKSVFDLVKNSCDGAKNIASQIKSKVVSATDSVKKGFEKSVEWVSEKIAAILEQFKVAINCIAKIISKGVSSVKEFIDAISEMFSSMGDNLSEIAEKFGMYKIPTSNDAEIKKDIDECLAEESEYVGKYKELTSRAKDGEKGFLGRVMNTVVSIMVDKEKSGQLVEGGISESSEYGTLDLVSSEELVLEKYLQDGELITESKLSDAMDAIAKNPIVNKILFLPKTMTRVGFSFVRSAIASIFASFAITWGTRLLCSVVFGMQKEAIEFVLSIVQGLWYSRGYIKLTVNAWKGRKKGDGFFDIFNKAYWMQLAWMILIPYLLKKIDAMNYLLKGLKMFCDWTGLTPYLDEIAKNFIKWIDEVIDTDWGTTLKETPVLRQIFKHIDGAEAKYDDALNAMGNVAKAFDAIGDNLLKSGYTDDELGIFKKSVEDLTMKNRSANGTAPIWKNSIESFNDESTNTPKGIAFTLTGVVGKPNESREVQRILSEFNKEQGSQMMNIVGETVRKDTEKVAGSMGLIMGTQDVDALTTKLGDLAKYVRFETVGTHDYNPITTETITEVTKDINYDDFFTSLGKVLVDTRWFPIFVSDGPLRDKATGMQKYKVKFASINSTNKSKKYYQVSDIKQMKLKDVDGLFKGGEGAKGIALITKHLNNVANHHKELLDKLKKQIDDTHKDDTSMQKLSRNFKKMFKSETKKYDKFTDIENANVVVYYILVNDKKSGKEVQIPGFMIEPTTMTCADLCDGYGLKARKNFYYLKGLFSKLTFAPIEKNDNDTKDLIARSLGTTMVSCAKANVQESIGSFMVEYDEEKKKFVPCSKDNLNNVKQIELGNLTVDELCDCLNDDSENGKQAYKLMGGEHSSIVRTGRKGFVVRENKRTLESLLYFYDKDKKRYKQVKNDEQRKKLEEQGIETVDFVDAFIIPAIEKDDTAEIYDEFESDDKLADLWLNDEKDDIDYDLINGKSKANIKKFMFRPMKTYSKTDDADLLKVVKEYKSRNKEYKGTDEDTLDAFKRGIEIIWDYLQSSEYWNKIKRNIKKADEKDKTKKKINEEFENYYEYLVYDAYETEDASNYILENTDYVFSFTDYCKIK